MASPSHVTRQKDDLLCTICIDIVEDIDSWLTSDTTEQQIVDWLNQICQVTMMSLQGVHIF